MAIRVLRLDATANKLGVSKSKLYEMMNPKSPRFEDTFPKKVRIGANSVGWLEHEIDNWVLSRQEV